MADADALRDPGAALPVTSGDDAPPPSADGTVMSLVDHLGELRTRLFRIILAVVAGSAAGFYFATGVRNFLVELLPTGTVPSKSCTARWAALRAALGAGRSTSQLRAMGRDKGAGNLRRKPRSWWV